jgi:hypothetical protein
MSVAQFKIEKEWKEFSISLPKIEEWMKANAGASYCGNQAGARLELWFTEEPIQGAKDAIDAYWDAIDGAHVAATSYISAADLKAAYDAARLDAVTKQWNDMSVAQRKIVSSIALSSAEEAQLVIDFGA